MWVGGHVVLHAAILVRIRLTNYHDFFPLQLLFCQESNASHFRILECVIHVPISKPQRTNMAPQKVGGIGWV